MDDLNGGEVHDSQAVTVAEVDYLLPMRRSDFGPTPTGIYSDISEERYHAGPEVSVSALKNFERAPLAAIASEPEESKALHMGDVFHTMLLQPTIFDAKFMVTKLKRISEREKATQDELAKADGRELVKQDVFDTARRMVDAVRGHSSLIREILDSQIDTEQSMYWIDPATRLLCRGRADVLAHEFRTIVDIKTSVDATADAFSKACYNYAYHWQAHFYRTGMPLAGGWDPQAFVFLVIEKEPPFLVGLYEIQPRALLLAADEVERNMRRWAECARAKNFPGLPADAPVPLDLPPWAYTR